MTSSVEQTIFKIVFESDKGINNESVGDLLKHLNVDIIFVASIDKRNAAINITDILSLSDSKGFNRYYPHSMDIIQFVEKAFDENGQYTSKPFDMVNDLCNYYLKKSGPVLLSAMYRDNGAFDGVVGLIDFKNSSREWSEDDRNVALKLANAYRHKVAIGNIESEYKNSMKEIKRKYEGQIEVLDVATNEYKVVFVIDYETELIQPLYGKLESLGIKTNSTRIGDYNKFEKIIKEEFSNNKPDALNSIPIKNVKARIKTQNNYFVNLTKNIKGNDSTIIFKYSPMVIEGRRSIVLSIRTVTNETDYVLKRAAELDNTLNYNRHYDSLTALYKRNMFIKEATNVIDLKNGEYYLLTFDIDRFSVYNSFYGIPAGDGLLRYTADVLNLLVRNFNITYGKLSNDNFVVLLVGDLNILEDFCFKLRSKMKVFDERFALRISIGVYQILDDETSIMNAIDYSMEAKKNNKDRVDELYCLFDDSMAENREMEQEVINAMDGAIEKKEFTIFLQPKIDVNTSKIVGAEALVRWIKDGKLIPPYKFVPIFEKNGFIKQMDMYVWEETLKYIRWRMDNNLEVFPISVNVSRVFMTIPTFVDDVTNLCTKYGVETKYLELEITESIFMEDVRAIKTTFDALRLRGFKILMDDFGSGYSSLNVLKDIDFDVLKVDLKFFSRNDDRSLKIIQTVINLSKALNIPAIAEGVETDEYVKILRDYGCPYAQGYYYSKPVDKDTFNEYVKNIGVSK
ncbi:MAG: bifunctional diguanylate cyclase/phosphodiesterase [Acholeplasmatales bacterium]|nr:bifunctional diguanylate cyclase/phosphodiesterase [Acholeplasmatales bacterium]